MNRIAMRTAEILEGLNPWDFRDIFGNLNEAADRFSADPAELQQALAYLVDDLKDGAYPETLAEVRKMQADIIRG